MKKRFCSIMAVAAVAALSAVTMSGCGKSAEKAGGAGEVYVYNWGEYIDEDVIAHFTRGAGINTLSTLIYSEVRRGIKPSMYALSTIIFLTVLILLLITNFAPKRKKH